MPRCLILPRVTLFIYWIILIIYINYQISFILNCETSYLSAVQMVLGIGKHDRVELQKNQPYFFPTDHHHLFLETD